MKSVDELLINCQNDITRETLEILKRGSYINRKGEEIDIRNSVSFSLVNSKEFEPGYNFLEKESPNRRGFIEITEETTLNASYRMVVDEGESNVACLNFASAYNPGGGFTAFARAQEETLARSSGLYLTLIEHQNMYIYNRSHRNPYYSDYMISSHNVPVFRASNYQLLDQPYLVSFITSPSVNAKAVSRTQNADSKAIFQVMTTRIRKILHLAIEEGYDNLVLGAFGCGAFGNDSKIVAGIFYHLLEEQNMKSFFNRIVFAIYERKEGANTVQHFIDRFQGSVKA